MPYGWSSIQRTAATMSGRSSRPMSHNLEPSLERVWSPETPSSFSTDVAQTEICVSYEATALLSIERPVGLVKLGRAYLLRPRNFAGIREEDPNKLPFAPSRKTTCRGTRREGQQLRE